MTIPPEPGRIQSWPAARLSHACASLWSRPISPCGIGGLAGNARRVHHLFGQRKRVWGTGSEVVDPYRPVRHGWLFRVLVRRENLHQDPVEGSNVICIEGLEKTLAHEVEVPRDHFREAFATRRSEACPIPAAIFVAGPTLYQSFVLHAVEQTGQATGGEEHPAGEIGHPEPACNVELRQHVEAGKGQAVAASHVARQVVHDGGVDAKKTPPRPQLPAGERLHDGYSVAAFGATLK